MEVATKEESNPIKQDMKKGKLRDYPLDIFWNYGMALCSSLWAPRGHDSVADMYYVYLQRAVAMYRSIRSKKQPATTPPDCVVV
jgi:hypothetical protein